ncbi:glycosyltransferase family 2 protein, partial [Patescibacteria group bacterium]|nr:glycosyltransferase family 2 protein [Patescibacteria group bacterium]
MKNIIPKVSDYRKYRILEMIPGFLVWGTFILAVAFSFILPLGVIYFIIAFDIYWLLRILYMSFFMMISYYRYRRTIKINWLPKVSALENWTSYYHVIFFPTYKEPYAVLEGSLSALANNHYPLDKFIVILAGEEKDKQNFLNIAARLESKFSDKFFKFVVTLHPKGLPGELAGKGSNIAWAGRQVKKIIDELGFSYNQVIVSSFDSDTCVHPEYFTYLTYKYITHPNPTRASFQPLAMFNNNIWEAPPVTRVISYSTTFWLMTDQSRPERLFTFSSHSMSFQALVDVNFWQNDIVTEDSRIGLQCIMEYDGNYEIVPMYIPVSMDVVVGKTFWQTLKAQYIQQRRWAYGVENFPYMIWNFGRNKKISLLKKVRYIFNQTEGVYSWSTAPILILLLGYLPIWVANSRGLTNVVAQNAPDIL